ncbi:MAG: hypothetical protein SFV18_08695 [Bryobacteraceae bacterium]|nr:hypothetical protein [Bryobacteraceae bacterium]
MFNWAALAAQPLLAGYLAWKKSSTGEWTVSLFLVGAVLYAGLYKWILSDWFKPEQFAVEERRRLERIAVGIDALAHWAISGVVTEAGLQRIEDGALHTILSEVEKQVGDVEGIYLNVSLIVEHPTDPARLLCINRADLNRPVPKAYLKTERVVWPCIERGEVVNVPAHQPVGDEKYRSILAMPLDSTRPGGVSIVGAVTIDSSVPGHFLDIQGSLRSPLSPALKLLAACVEGRRTKGLWPAGLG